MTQQLITKRKQLLVKKLKQKHMPNTPSFYPNISSLVTINDFPEELQFLENGLQNALNNIYYKRASVCPK